ncbi:hypothetical protein GCM10009076_15880 [Erythrobacter ramosus]
MAQRAANLRYRWRSASFGDGGEHNVFHVAQAGSLAGCLKHAAQPPVEADEGIEQADRGGMRLDHRTKVSK